MKLRLRELSAVPVFHREPRAYLIMVDDAGIIRCGYEDAARSEFDSHLKIPGGKYEVEVIEP